jgi:hypothetical protein
VSDECLISDSSDGDTDDCANVIALADSVLEENSEVEEEGQGYFLGDADWNGGFIWEDVDNYHGQRELYPGHCGPQNSAINVKGIVSCVFIVSQ